MAEENKSQLISEAELIEAINADSIISVSLGAGQPQKNVKLSTLASVVAGLIGIKGFQATLANQTANLLYAPKKNTSGVLIAFNTNDVTKYWFGLYNFVLNSKPTMSKISGTASVNNTNDVGTVVFNDTSLNKFILMY